MGAFVEAEEVPDSPALSPSDDGMSIELSKMTAYWEESQKSQPSPVLSNISLRVRRTELLMVVGPSALARAVS